MKDEKYRTATSAIQSDPSGIVRRIEELGQRCDTLEATNSFLAAQLTEVNEAWRDAIAAIAGAAPERVAPAVAAVREMATKSTGLRQRIFLEMADILERTSKPR